MSAFNPSDYDYLFKVLIIGDSAVGKSRIVRRYTAGTFEKNWIGPVGLDFKSRTSNVHGKRIKLQIWDASGQGRLPSFESSCYTGVHSVVLVYDMTDIESLTSCKGYWLGEVNKHQNLASDIPVLLVGNKCDALVKLPGPKQQKIIEMANDFALTNNLAHVQTSAKTGENIDAAFSYLTEKMIENNN